MGQLTEFQRLLARIFSNSFINMISNTDERVLEINRHSVLNSCYNVHVMKCPKCFNPLRRVATTEDAVWFTCPLGHRFHSETGSGISDAEGHRYSVSAD